MCILKDAQHKFGPTSNYIQKAVQKVLPTSNKLPSDVSTSSISAVRSITISEVV